MASSEPSGCAGDDRRVVRELELVSLLGPEVADLVVESFVALRFAFGQPIVRQGDRPDGLYVLASGRARSIRVDECGDEVALGVLEPGDSFGQRTLLTGQRRSTTVRASGDVTVFRLDPPVFEALTRVYPHLRIALSAQARARELESFLRRQPAFSRLPRGTVISIVSQLREIELDGGASVVREGDPAGSLFVVREGRLVAYRGEPRQVAAYIRAGDFIGEPAQGSAMSATVEAVTPVRLLEIEEPAVRRLMRDEPGFRSLIDEHRAARELAGTATVPLDFADEHLTAPTTELAVALAMEPGRVAPEPPMPSGVVAFEGAQPGPAETTGVGRSPRARRSRFPFVRQLDEMDCGVACMAMVCRHFGRAVAISHLRLALGTGVDGTSLRAIQRGGEFVGLDVQAVKASKSRLDELPLPAIVHVDQNHWVVLYGLDRTGVHLADPARGRRRLERAEFLRRWSGYAALVSPTPRLAEAPVASTGRARWLWQFVRPHVRALVVAVLLTLVGAGFQMLVPVMTQRVVDDVLVHRDYELLRLLGLGLLAVSVAGLAASLLRGRLLSRVAVRIDAAALDFVTARLLRLPMTYFETRRTGDLQSRIDGLRQARQIAVQQGLDGLTNSVQLVSAMVVMFGYSATLALIFSATIPVYALVLRMAGRRIRPTLEGLQEGFGRYGSTQIDAVRGIETVKSLGAEQRLRNRLLTEFSALTQRIVRADYTMLGYGATITLATSAVVVAFIWLGALRVLDGGFSVGEFVAFNALVLLATAPLQGLLSSWDQLQQTSVLLGRVQDVLEQEPEQDEVASLRPVSTLEGRVTLRQVGFSYPTAPSAPILTGISLDIEPGTKVAVVGRSGSGKSTLLKCLAGLLEVTQGSIAYDGIELRRLRYPELRRRLGFVVQQPHLFNDTIARNIGFADDEPDLERVHAAARVADAHEFILRLPMGYETLVGESGLRLSGGQQQRISIARAVYHRPAVLLLDEATSSLDAESERVVKRNIDKLLHGRTAFLVAHRMSTIRDADLIIVLEHGRVVEVGDHEQLMRRGGLYCHLQSQQLGATTVRPVPENGETGLSGDVRNSDSVIR